MEFLNIDLSIWVLGALIFACFVAGFIDSVAGGGGLILLPSFILAGLPPQVALGQGKLVSTFGTLAAIRNFVKNKKIIWKMVATGIPCGLLGSYFGAEMILLFEPEVVAKIIIGLLPFGIMLTLIPKKNHADHLINLTNIQLYLIVPIIVFVIGFYDGFFGPGTGSFLILALHLILRFDLVSASANSKLLNFSSNVGALMAFVIAGKVLYMLAIPLIIANLVGNHIGSSSAIKHGPKVVRVTLSVSMTLLMSTLVYQFIL
jgi:uncharacterized membrane protein YfcA